MITTIDPPTDLAPAVGLGDGRREARRRTFRVLRRPVNVIALVFLTALVFCAVFAPFVAPRDPNAISFDGVYAHPGWGHLLGNDEVGRDILSRLIFGARTSLVAAFQAVGISLVLGVPLGLLAGYRGGWGDKLLSRISDAIMSVPNLILALAVVSVMGQTLRNAMLAIGIVFMPRVFRIVRASAMEVCRQPFIEAAEAMGCTRTQIVWTHVLPNVLSPLLIVVSVSLGTAVLAEASLSYLGLGAVPPTASWGGMIAGASQRLDLKFLIISPGLALVCTVAAFMVVGDALRTIFGSQRGQQDD